MNFVKKIADFFRGLLPKKTESVLCNLTYIYDLVASIKSACYYKDKNISKSIFL